MDKVGAFFRQAMPAKGDGKVSYKEYDAINQSNKTQLFDIVSSAIDDSSYRLNFDLDKQNKIHHHS